MARQEVVQIKCDRCKRVELQPASAEKKAVPDFEARMSNLYLKYDDLCNHCKSALGRLWQEISEWDRELTQKLLGEQQAAPLSTAPDYTPPKPHSPAAAKR